MGSRDVANESAREWASSLGERASNGTFTDAAEFGEVVFNCTGGTISLAALEQAGEDALRDKVLVDVANVLDSSRGRPPAVIASSTDSLAEQIQRRFPGTRVVKSLNTINNEVMVDPGMLEGEHHVFVSGDDADAKSQVSDLLESFGWPRERIVDLGGLETARAAEMYVALWVRLLQALGTPRFNIGIVR